MTNKEWWHPTSLEKQEKVRLAEKERSDQEALAGYILTFDIIIKQVAVIRDEHKVPVKAQVQLLQLIYGKVIEKSPWIFYQIENYFNNQDFMIGGFGGLPLGKQNDA